MPLVLNLCPDLLSRPLITVPLQLSWFPCCSSHHQACSTSGSSHPQTWTRLFLSSLVIPSTTVLSAPSYHPLLPCVIFLCVFFWPCHAAGRILVPRPGIEPATPRVEARSLYHWTVREVPVTFLNSTYYHLTCYACVCIKSIFSPYLFCLLCLAHSRHLLRK